MSNSVFPPRFFRWAAFNVGNQSNYPVTWVSVDFNYESGDGRIPAILIKEGETVIAHHNLNDPISIWMYNVPAEECGDEERNPENHIVHFGRFSSLPPKCPGGSCTDYNNCNGCEPCQNCNDWLQRSSAAVITVLEGQEPPSFLIEKVCLGTGENERAVYTGIGLGDIRDCRGGGDRCRKKFFHFIETLPLEISIVEDDGERFIRYRYPTPFFPYEVEL